MRAREFIFEGYPEALVDFGREADPTEVKAVIDQYKQLVNKNQFREPREKNIDYWRAQGWTAFSQMVKLKSSDITDSQLKKGRAVGNAITLQDDANWTVVIPLDKETSVHYGRGTDWCTTKRNRLFFENYFYEDKITLIYAIPKNKESNKHVAISITPKGIVEMFDQSDTKINAQQYTQLSGLDPSKFIEMSKEPANQQQMESQREKYKQALTDTRELLQETPLDVDAIERLLKFTKNSNDCYNYIVAYGREQNKRVTVHPIILIAAAMYVENSNTSILASKAVGHYIDFSTITSSVFKSILRSDPKIFAHNYKLLSSEQLAMFAITPASALQYAILVLNGTAFSDGEPAIATSAEHSFDYAEMLGKPFPAGEPAIATDANYSYQYAKLLDKPFPAGEAAIATSAIYSYYYAELLVETFPAGEAAIATSAEYSFRYAKLLGDPFPAGEAVIATSAIYSYWYAEMLGKPFPAGEAAIAKDENLASDYTRNILAFYQSPSWEKIIKDDPRKSYDYAIVRNQPFLAGEAAIATSAEYSFKYAKLLDDPFPAGEAAIATSAEYSARYAQMLHTSFPAGEPAIATNNSYTQWYVYEVVVVYGSDTWENIIKDNPQASFIYANVKKTRFPAGEAAIAADHKYANRYDGMFGTNLSQQ